MVRLGSPVNGSGPPPSQVELGVEVDAAAAARAGVHVAHQPADDTPVLGVQAVDEQLVDGFADKGMCAGPESAPRRSVECAKAQPLVALRREHENGLVELLVHHHAVAPHPSPLRGRGPG
jgi:hypothetical protein